MKNDLGTVTAATNRANEELALAKRRVAALENIRVADFACGLRENLRDRARERREKLSDDTVANALSDFADLVPKTINDCINKILALEAKAPAEVV